MGNPRTARELIGYDGPIPSASTNAKLLLVVAVLMGYGLQTGGHLHEGLPDRLLGYEFGEPPTLGGFFAENIFEIGCHRIRR
jgi:hypothetical protein